MRRKRNALAGLLALALASASAAVAAWAISSNGGGYVKAVSVPQGSTPTKAITTWPNVAVSWAAVTVGGGTADSYTIRRYLEAGAVQTILANCSGAITVLTCTENTVPVGRWHYTTQPKKGANWLGVESAKTSTIAIVAAPSSLSCTSCSTFGGQTKYINLAGKAAVSLSMILAATSLASDTVNLSLTDTVPTAVNNTTAASAGAGTVSPAALDTTTLIDGVVTASARLNANTGDLSPATTLALIRDVVVPSAADIRGNNGGTAGTIADGDSVTYTFSEAPDPASIKTSWTGTSTAVSVDITNNGSADAVTVTGTNLGGVNTAANYVAANRTCGTSTMVLAGSDVTVTFGGCTGLMRTGIVTSLFIWTPTATMKDQAQNPMSVTARTATALSRF